MPADPDRRVGLLHREGFAADIGVLVEAAIEARGRLGKIAWQVLGTDAVMSADEPGFDVAEQEKVARNPPAQDRANPLDTGRTKLLINRPVTFIEAKKKVIHRISAFIMMRLSARGLRLPSPQVFSILPALARRTQMSLTFVSRSM